MPVPCDINHCDIHVERMASFTVRSSERTFETRCKRLAGGGRSHSLLVCSHLSSAPAFTVACFKSRRSTLLHVSRLAPHVYVSSRRCRLIAPFQASLHSYRIAPSPLLCKAPVLLCRRFVCRAFSLNEAR